MENKGFYKKILDCIYSIKNIENNNKFHKVITVFGFKFKFVDSESRIERLENNVSLSKKSIFEELNKVKKEICIFKNWQSNFYKDFPDEFPQSLSESEKMTLCKYYANSSNYLEFGSGGSTFIALNNPNLIINSVESDKNWLDYILSYFFLNNAHKENRLKFHYVDIGKIRAWGYPVDDTKKENYPFYSSGVFNNINNKAIDLVFIDGRFRVACALATILNCSKDVIIMIHDYSGREEYHILEKYLSVVEIVDTLAIFKIKDNINFAEIKKSYDEYKYSLL